jgi:hypothetical protein
VDPRRLRIWEWLLGIGGVALLGSMFRDWYEGGGAAASAWEAFSVLDLLLLLVALLAIGAAVMAAVHATPAASLALASLTALVGLPAAIFLLVRLLSPPGDDLSLVTGAWVGLAAMVTTLAGAAGSMRSERFPAAARIDVPIEQISPPEGGKA